nr:hypothetical protein [Halovenus rubra]
MHIAKQTDGSLELSDIAEQIAAWENGKSLAEITSDERHRVYTSMQQTHLPTMDRAGVINYDNGTVTLTEEATNLDVYLDVVPEQSIPWGQYYLGLSAFSAALLASVLMGVFPASVPNLAWGGIVVGLFSVSALYHVWESQRMRLGAAETPPDIGQ